MGGGNVSEEEVTSKPWAGEEVTSNPGPSIRRKKATRVTVHGAYSDLNNLGRFGGVFRDANDQWVEGWFGVIHRVSKLDIEVWAIIHAIYSISGGLHDNITVESCSQNAIDVFEHRRDTPSSLLKEMKRVRESLCQMNVVFKRVYHNDIHVAERLADMGPEHMTRFEVLKEPTDELQEAIYSDMEANLPYGRESSSTST